jgi:hypothetical protein
MEFEDYNYQSFNEHILVQDEELKAKKTLAR